MSSWARSLSAFLRERTDAFSAALEATIPTTQLVDRGQSTLAIAQIQPIFAGPTALFNNCLVALMVTNFTIRSLQSASERRGTSGKSGINATTGTEEKDINKKPASVQSLQLRYLPVFWLLRTAFWMSGPYIYPVYASKYVNGAPATPTLINRIFLIGFASIALLGPTIGRALNRYGRKMGTIAAAAMCGLGALSTLSSNVSVMFIGRALGSVGSNLLSSAPEAWLVSQATKSGDDPTGRYLIETFGLAYSYDSVVAIAAGQLGGWAARLDGPTGPFKLTQIFLALAGTIVIAFWGEENRVARPQQNQRAETAPPDDGEGNKEPTIRDALDKILADRKIMMVGAVYALFESAMYIFVLQWSPAMSKAVTQFFGPDVEATPNGTIFSCYMACCMFGSTAFSQLAKWNISTERSAAWMIAAATVAMAGVPLAVLSHDNISLAGLVVTFFAFEACVGMYFPSIGTLRSRYIPESHRSIIMTLFAVPLNVLVVGVFLFYERLGMRGALCIAAIALGMACVCMIRLQSIRQQEAKANWAEARKIFRYSSVINALKEKRNARQHLHRMASIHQCLDETKNYRIDMHAF